MVFKNNYVDSMEGRGSSVNFKCLFPCDVQIQTSPFSVRSVSGGAVKDTITEFGSMNQAFEINLYNEPTFTTKQVGQHFVGQTLFASVDWRLNTLKDSVNFYLKSCIVKQNGLEFYIVKDKEL